jgi:hypothetical protein
MLATLSDCLLATIATLLVPRDAGRYSACCKAIRIDEATWCAILVAQLPADALSFLRVNAQIW